MKKQISLSLFCFVLVLGACSSQNKKGQPTSQASDKSKVYTEDYDFSSADQDGNGYLELDEAEDQVGVAFDHADKNKNQTLTGGELGGLSDLDLDKNGSLTLIEAMDATEKQFGEIDQKKRGLLDSKQSSKLSITK